MRAIRRVPYGNAPVSYELNVSVEAWASVGESAARRYRVIELDWFVVNRTHEIDRKQSGTTVKSRLCPFPCEGAGTFFIIQKENQAGGATQCLHN